ncbi:MAG: hypothetical protein Q9212_000503 [Teloschistes hypoglaucus]
MSVEVSLNTPLAEALSNAVQPKLTEIGWATGQSDDLALGEYIVLMLVNGKSKDQIAAELSNDLLQLAPDDTGAVDFAKWLFEQVYVLNAQLNGSAAPSSQETQEGQSNSTYPSEEGQSQDQNRQLDADMSEAMEDVQDGSMTGNRRLMGQLSKAMDRSGDAALHRVRPQQGTERINMHNRQPPKGPRIDQNRNQRGPPNLRAMSTSNGVMSNGGPVAPMMNASPQQQMVFLAMLEEQARMMSQMLSPNQQSFMPGMPQPAINPNFRPGSQSQPYQPDRSLFERVDRPSYRQNGSVNKRQPYNSAESQSHNNNDSTGAAGGVGQDATNGDFPSSMEVESSQKSQSELPSDTICKFNLKCTKKDCQFAHQSPAAPPGITLDLSSDCPFGARCQNRKCVMRHPSPAQNLAHSAGEDCRYFPNCTNPTCPFRHPTSVTPVCRFGENCTRPDCKFKHISITCKFNPCLNANCPYKHAEGQKKAKLGDNIWTPNSDQEKDHVSERKFVDDKMMEELVVPESNQAHSSEPSSLGPEFTTTSGQLGAADAEPGINNIAVLGGGITGLASALYLAQRLPRAQITLFEGSSRLGGWLRSTQVDITNLGLEDQVLMTSKESVAAQNRFIYFPDHLVRLPGPGASVSETFKTLSDPLFNGLTWACLTEIARRAKNDDDESIGSFISRRLNSDIADNIFSAGMHGIYAGDIYQLSVRSILPWFWHAEKAMGSMTKAVIGKWNLRWARDERLEAMRARIPPVSSTIEAVRKSSVYTFRKGIGQLADSLATKLKTLSNVKIRQETLVDSIQLLESADAPSMQLMTRSKENARLGTETENFDYVISTISGKALDGIVRPYASLPTLSQTPSVTVMVVNLYFSNPSVLPARGFGYLLPRSLPFEQNPERALGVVFDSDASIGQDEIPGTKVTVMLGGHWWDGWTTYPDEEQGATMAKAILKRHLGIFEEPQAVRVGLQKNCIPQYTVGHHARMAKANNALKKFNGRLRVAGNSYNGVGLNDCVRSAEDVVMGLVEGSKETGLEFFDEKNIPISPYSMDH